MEHRESSLFTCIAHASSVSDLHIGIHVMFLQQARHIIRRPLMNDTPRSLSGYPSKSLSASAHNRSQMKPVFLARLLVARGGTPARHLSSQVTDLRACRFIFSSIVLKTTKRVSKLLAAIYVAATLALFVETAYLRNARALTRSKQS